MSGISTHVLDTSRGIAAAGVVVALEREDAPGRWTAVNSATTDADGRVKSLLPPGTALAAATYRLRFEIGAYFADRGVATFFPRVEVAFVVGDAARNHHVPLLVSPFRYSTYRGT